ncbi:hypothetical protein [Streptococcus pluranimalium]|uniref:hypothetical protein n=1 Tax=Streptococcus pluranimalium TaxID=82348 RepID=UPI0013B3FA67|nr:hypothetical protein [Streptococcus pluranimalium]
MKRIFAWYEFKDRFRTAEPEFYNDFQATRHDLGLYGTESEQEQEQRQRYFSLDR